MAQRFHNCFNQEELAMPQNVREQIAELQGRIAESPSLAQRLRLEKEVERLTDVLADAEAGDRGEIENENDLRNERQLK